ncbi:hypothetical protein HK104_004508 [Borealophlyctis nickersoniae]|nr:hypothetical protein HK104_004508 [Borealophlyctis nickersoniae]
MCRGDAHTAYGTFVGVDVESRVGDDGVAAFPAPAVVAAGWGAFEEEAVLEGAGDALGSGNFAKVKRAIRRDTGQRYAVKIMHLSRFALKPKFLENLNQEVSILMSVNHTNIIRIFEIFYEKDYVYIVLELADGGELFDAIIKHGKFSEDVSRKIILQVFNGLKYLHDRGISHRDLKPENILFVHKNYSSDWHIKISDFGLAKLTMSEEQMMRTLCGTPNYVAPEVLMQASERAYTKAVDLWSCEELAPPSMTEQIKAGLYQYQSPYWDEISDDAKDLIDKLLTVDPTQRLSVDQALQHPWIKTQNLRQTVSCLTVPLPSFAFSRGDTMVTPPATSTAAQGNGRSNGTKTPTRSTTPTVEDGQGEVAGIGRTLSTTSIDTVTADSIEAHSPGTPQSEVPKTGSATPKRKGRRTREVTPPLGGSPMRVDEGTPRRSKRVKK